MSQGELPWTLPEPEGEWEYTQAPVGPTCPFGHPWGATERIAELEALLIEQREALIAEMGGRKTVESLAAMTEESYERLPPHAKARVDRARLALSRLEAGTKKPCLYPLPDGRRCLECATCQPTPEEVETGREP